MTIFTNKAGYKMRRCECGTAILPIHTECVVCSFNNKEAQEK